jgi:hypothetical protein
VQNKISYNPGEVVFFAAVPNKNYVFVGGSGDLTGNINPAIIVMDGDKTVTATFRNSKK